MRRDESQVDMATGENALLTVSEAADLLRVDRKVVYSLAGRGGLPGVRRVGRSIRIHKKTLLSWLSTGECGA